MNIKVFVILFLSLVYAVVRYNIFGPVEPQHIPVYIFNKAISVSAVILFFMASIYFYKNKPSETLFYGRLSYHFVLIHIFLSLAIFTADYYPKFFAEVKLNIIGELSVLSGVLGLYFYWLIRNKKLNDQKRLPLKIYAILFIGAHVFVMGFKGWFNVAGWHGSLPPISLISFIFALGSLVYLLLKLNQIKKPIDPSD